MTHQSSANGITWDLSDLYRHHTDPAIERDVAETYAHAETFAATYRNTINATTTADHMRRGLEQLETLYENMARPLVYANLLFAADTSNDDYRNLQQRLEQRYTDINNLLIFFSLEWLHVAEEDAQRLLNDPMLASYRHYLEQARLYKTHTLTEAEERIINEKDVTGTQAWQRLFTEHIASLSFALEKEGSTHHLTLDQVLVHMRDPNRDIRQRAHTSLFTTLTDNAHTLSFIYNTLLQDHITMNRLRDYRDPMMQRHLANEIAPETVATMLDVVEQNYPLAQAYFTRKAQLLALPQLEIYDQYAPIGESRVRMGYEHAQQTILDAFGAFSSDFRTIANRFFTGNWIDAEIRTGKRGGAFCSGFSPHTHPYVLCNYTDDLRDVMTVAHELGHGIHFWLSGTKQHMLNYHATLPLCETASVFGEMLVFEHILAQQTDRQTRVALLCGKLEDLFATVFRQTVLTRFEQAAFAARATNRLTPDQLNTYWREANARYYGNAVAITNGYEAGWSYIPHFIHTPFYCYSYVFGVLLVLALYSLYRQQGEAFVLPYRTLLESGGSKTPDELLAPLGINTRDPAFWQGGFDELRRLIEQLDELIEQP